MDIGNFDEHTSAALGLHEKESLKRSDFSWTNQFAQIYFDLPPNLPPDHPKTVKLRTYAQRPPDSQQPNASFKLNDVPLGSSLDIPRNPTIIEFHLPQNALKPENNCFSLSTDFWQPSQTGSSNDSRILGIIIDWILID
jgi:hypothetical protein